MAPRKRPRCQLTGLKLLAVKERKRLVVRPNWHGKDYFVCAHDEGPDHAVNWHVWLNDCLDLDNCECPPC